MTIRPFPADAVSSVRPIAMVVAALVLFVAGCGSPDFTGKVVSIDNGDETRLLIDVSHFKSYKTDKIVIRFKEPVDTSNIEPGSTVRVWTHGEGVMESAPPQAFGKKIKVIE